MNIKKCFLIISLFQVTFSCTENEKISYNLKTSLVPKVLSEETIEYCKGSTLTLKCTINMRGCKHHALYSYIIFKCVDVKCKFYVQVKLVKKLENAYIVLLLADTYNNNRYGCGIIEMINGQSKTYIGSKVYLLKFYKPTAISTSGTTTTTEGTTQPSIYQGTDSSGVSPWIWQAIVGVLLLVFCGFLGWLIKDILKINKRRNVTRDTSTMNYENLSEHDNCPESSNGTRNPKQQVIKNNKDQESNVDVSETREEKRNSIYDVYKKDQVYYNVGTNDKHYSKIPDQLYVNVDKSEHVEPYYCEIP